MCTVSYVPSKQGITITSNRDEHISRGIAIYPDFYQINDKKLVYPKDNKAAGTWFISNESGDVGVLLNGAFEKHIPLGSYRKSRGYILPEIFQHDSPYEALKILDLNGIENFTLILWEKELLREFKWDGQKRKVKIHDKLEPHIWSSVTLYDEQMIKERHQWFNAWAGEHADFNQTDILKFHENTQTGNSEYGLCVSRKDKIMTTSITSINIENLKASIYHKDLMQKIETSLKYDLMQVPYIILPLSKESTIAQYN